MNYYISPNVLCLLPLLIMLTVSSYYFQVNWPSLCDGKIVANHDAIDQCSY